MKVTLETLHEAVGQPVCVLIEQLGQPDRRIALKKGVSPAESLRATAAVVRAKADDLHRAATFYEEVALHLDNPP